ncbi:HAD family hydrolase [Streptomyces heilongjiangensis]|uniref:HAD family hydrolase n=1 Tax=Streptomyces heilongjiangensis TaxID=945052 RepID=A0ABW1BCP1_9ACTN|nr:HAD family hydrolase [Streptomyces heilongjiangensis]MDC2952065.1 HAD family hydrolase [Streptomyces heilongjiangensis]
MYDLVIFDNDGVLVDSEPISNRHLAAYLTEIGHPTSYEESVRDYMGSAMHRVHELIHERTGRRLPEDFDEVFHTRVFAAFERELKPIAGVFDVLEQLVAQGVPYCVASSGSHERIRVGHRTTGLDRWFGDGLVFSAQDVGRGKPAPDLFLHAAERMAVAPERCAVVEDSPLGVRAGVAAGMDVYGFTAMTPAEKLTGVQGHFSDMAELLPLLS